LFTKVVTEAMPVQQQKIEETLDAYQDNMEQRDDITVMGVRIK